jgi:hypothetical protein
MEPVNGTKMQPFFTTIMHDMLSIALRELESWTVKHSMGEKHPGNLNNEFFVMNQALFFCIWDGELSGGGGQCHRKMTN